MRKVSRQNIGGEEQDVEVLYPSMYFSVEKIGTGSSGVNNIYLNSVRVAGVLRDGQARYYLTDQVDSVKVVTDDSGLVQSRMEYLPFGESWIQEDMPGFEGVNAPKYNSQELDKETGYYFYNARHYDPEIARFVTPDTVVDGEEKDENGKIIRSDPLGWNRFSYCKGNPIIYKDPTGHLVDAVYEQKKGLLTIIDRDTKEKVIVKVESGGKPYGDPIPKGKFEILDHSKKDDRVGRRFRLDALDEKPRNDKVEATGQSNLRLHKPGRTTGCIAAKDEKEWEKAKQLIEKTKTIEVTDKSKPFWKIGGKDEKIKKFGELIVK